MPDTQASNAPDPEDRPAGDARDDRTAASVLADDDNTGPGGGALIGGGTGGGMGTPGGGAGGASPNSPLADAVVGGGDPEAEARTQAAQNAPDEGHPASS